MLAKSTGHAVKPTRNQCQQHFICKHKKLTDIESQHCINQAKLQFCSCIVYHRKQIEQTSLVAFSFNHGCYCQREQNLMIS